MNIGDVITTAEEFDGLPAGSLVIDTRFPVASPWQRYGNGKWDDLGTDGTAPLLSASEMQSRHQGRLTVVYIPGRLPRPERVVKAEALREAAVLWDLGKDDWRQRVADWLGVRARHVEAGDAL